MGWGLISRYWGSFAAAIALTALGDVGAWLTWSGFLTWPYNSIGWYVWFPAAAAYVLGPAYQAEALRRANRNANTNTRLAA